MKIFELLNKFQLNIPLPQNILNFDVEGEYKEFEKTKMSLPYITKYAIESYDVFETYLFKSDENKIFIAPNNFYNMLGIYKKYNEKFYGSTYNFKGELIGRN